MPDTKKEHPYAHVLRAIADGEEIQGSDTCGYWWPASIDSLLIAIANGEMGQRKFRIKPKTININGYEVSVLDKVTIIYVAATGLAFVNGFLLGFVRGRYSVQPAHQGEGRE